MRLRWWLVAGYVVGASAGAQPAGYHVGATVVLPDSLVEVLARGRFRSTIPAPNTPRGNYPIDSQLWRRSRWRER